MLTAHEYVTQPHSRKKIICIYIYMYVLLNIQLFSSFDCSFLCRTSQFLDDVGFRIETLISCHFKMTEKLINSTLPGPKGEGHMLHYSFAHEVFFFFFFVNVDFLCFVLQLR